MRSSFLLFCSLALAGCSSQSHKILASATAVVPPRSRNPKDVEWLAFANKSLRVAHVDLYSLRTLEDVLRIETAVEDVLEAHNHRFSPPDRFIVADRLLFKALVEEARMLGFLEAGYRGQTKVSLKEDISMHHARIVEIQDLFGQAVREIERAAKE